MSASGVHAPSNILIATGVLDATAALTELHLADGRIVRLPTALLEGSATALSFEQGQSSEYAVRTASDETLIVPVLEERLEVGKRTVPTAKVRLHKTVHEFETALDEPLAVRTYDIERIVVNQPVQVAPVVRTEGETTIYPLVEERLILTKQLVLTEEIRVTKRDTERRDTQIVALRREHMEIEREPL